MQHASVIPATPEAEVGRWLEARRSRLYCTVTAPVNSHCTLAWATYQDLVSNLKKKKRKNRQSELWGRNNLAWLAFHFIYICIYMYVYIYTHTHADRYTYPMTVEIFFKGALFVELSFHMTKSLQ